MKRNETQLHTTSEAQPRPQPEVTPIYTGNHQKVVQGSSETAALMPRHFATHEAVVVVVRGNVEIHLEASGDSVPVASGESYVIKAEARHTLTSPGPFRLFLILPAAAEIRFEE